MMISLIGRSDDIKEMHDVLRDALTSVSVPTNFREAARHASFRGSGSGSLLDGQQLVVVD